MFRKYVLYVVMILVLSSSALLAVQINKGTGGLNQAITESLNVEEYVPVMIVMKEQYDTQVLYNKVKNLPKKERREVTISTLKQFSEETQADLKQFLLKKEKSKGIKSPKFLWIRNIVFLQSNLTTLQDLDLRDDIDRIVYDPQVKVLPDDEPTTMLYDEVIEKDEAKTEREIAYNVTQVGADKLWAEGYYGQGVVVAVLDSGLNYNHVDIKNSLWIHPDYPKYGYNFVNDTLDPMDGRWHGTHCAGTVAGDGTAGTQTGLAPKAKIMALKVLTDGGSLDQNTYHRGFEFAVEHGADVISNSVGFYHKYNPDRQTIRGIMENVLSAGIIASVAAANAGEVQNEYPIPDNVATPSDCPPPWLNPQQVLKGGVSAVFTSGATDINDDLAGFSSRGPVTWQSVAGYGDYPYGGDKMGLTKPDIASPGVDVKSLRHDDIRGYREDSGTSMAAPTTAGAIALLISKDPDITPELIAQYIEETAEKTHARVKNNDYGSGRLDVAAAALRINKETLPGAPYVSNPHNGEIEVMTETSLKWMMNRPTNSYTLYLGTDNPPTNVINGLKVDDTSYVPTGLLKPDTVYYWRVDAHNLLGDTEGEVWSFRTVLPISVNFESNTFDPYEWDFITSGQGAQKWFITDKDPYEGSYSAQSGEVNNGGSTRMRVSINVKEDGIVSFYLKTSTEERGDYIRFYIDNDIAGEWSGENEWNRVYFPVKAGIRSFSWLYVKDMMNSFGEDAVRVDNITFPRHAKPLIPYTPESLIVDLDYENIRLNWEIETNEDANPIEFSLQGYNIFLSVNGSEYQKLNTNLLTEQSYSYPYKNAGDYSFYTTAVYKIRGKIVESENSEVQTITIQPAVSSPVFTPEGGDYDSSITISIDSDLEGSETYYTTDGSVPTYNSTLYTEPIELSESTTIKARVYRLGYLPSDVTTAVYNIETTDVEESVVLPQEFFLRVYPNPLRKTGNTRSSESLTIEFSNPNPISSASIDIYNVKGRHIRRLDLVSMGSGVQSIQWDLMSQQSVPVANGIYYLKVSINNDHHIRKALILR